MCYTNQRSGIRWAALLVCGLCLAQAGCNTPEQTAGLVVGLTAAGAQSPTQEIQQVYYLGAYDPQEQLPPAVYRITVHGQASFISFMRFASGWVPAQLIDSLSSRIAFKVDEPGLEITSAPAGEVAALKPGRRLIQFGPEGFREVPKNHRLVVVMGSSPEKFFEAIDTALGEVAKIEREQRDSEVAQQVLAAMSELRSESDELDDLLDDLERDELVDKEEVQ